MGRTKTAQERKTTTKKIVKINKENAIEKYLSYKGNDYPSFEDFQVWCLTEKIMSLRDTLVGEYKGVLYVYGKRYLTNQIAAGTRGAGNLVIMLRELELQMEKEARATEDIIAPVQLIMDFEQPKKGKYERKKIKSK